MNFANYAALCEAMGAAKQAGHDLEADFDILDSSIQALIGAFSAGSYINVQELTRGSSNLQIEDTSAARDAINELCRKYGAPLVCAPAETARETASDVAAQVVALLSDPK